MTILAQDFQARVAHCGHEYRVPFGMSGRARKYCDACKPAPTVRYVAPGDAPDGFRQCAGCVDVFEVGPRDRNPRKWCSERCRVANYYITNPEYAKRNNILSNARAKANRIPTSHDLVCKVCHVGFTARWGNTKYCSKQCTYIAARAQRRAAKEGIDHEPYYRIDIFIRDGWICQLCGGPVDRDLIYPDPGTASIDHVIPISRGGHDTHDNIQLAHIGCNWSKGPRA